MSELESAWDDVHAANTMGWQVGRPYFHNERQCWEHYAFDPTERGNSDGNRSREWIAVGTAGLVPDSGNAPDADPRRIRMTGSGTPESPGMRLTIAVVCVGAGFVIGPGYAGDSARPAG